MTDDQQAPENKEDELDLLNLFERISRFFRNYFLLITICTFIGAALGFTLYKLLPKQYSSSLLLHSFTLTNTEQINIIENWNELLKAKEYATLGERLNCSPSLVSKVRELKAAEIQKLYSENNPNGFNVEVMVMDNTVLDSLQHGITYGLENSDYMKGKLASQRLVYQELIEKVKSEISKLDSTKNIIEKNLTNNNFQHSSSYILDVSNVNTQMISLTEKLLSYEQQLKFMNAVQVLHRFEKFQKPAAPKFLKLVVLGFIAGFAIGYVLALWLYVRKKLADRRILAAGYKL